MRPPLWLAGLALLVHGQACADAVDDYIRREMDARRIPGLGLAVVSKGQVVKSAGYGMADLENGTPVSPETAFKTASLSKPVIAAAVLLLVQDGKLRLEDTLGQFLPEVPPSWRAMTIRQLLSHTSGLPRDPLDYDPYKARPIIEVIRSGYGAALVGTPGETWLYSNLGYYLLAEIMTRVAGEPWESFIARRILAPADMRATQLATPAPLAPHRARGYSLRGGTVENAEDWIAVRPSGAFLSPAGDLAKWEIFIAGKGPLDVASLTEMNTPATLNNGTRTRYGFGWYIDTYLGRARLHHDGQYPGFRADYERFPDDDLAVIVLANADHLSLAPLAVRIAGFYAAPLAVPEITTVAKAPRRARRGRPLQIAIDVSAKDKAAPESIVELEIFDAAGASAHKQNTPNIAISAGGHQRLVYTWTPEKPGTFTVAAGVYGARYVPNYAWSENLATIEVE